MARSAIIPPQTDPTPIFELFRGNYATELLTAAVAHWDVFGILARTPLTFEALRSELGLEPRPAHVMITALRAFGLIVENRQGRLEATPVAREHLVRGATFDVSGYVGLAADSPGVVEMVERLKTNRPAGDKPDEGGTAFIYRPGVASAMDNTDSARSLTLALEGRARNVAPLLARCYSLEDARCVLDVGGGTGIYSIAWLQRHPALRAIIWDRPEVLRVAREIAEEHGVSSRVEFLAGDMLTDPVPDGVDVMLLSNVLHDWDVPACRTLIARCAAALAPGGRLLIHDVFLNDQLDGPLPIALYSAALFRMTEGRAYSAGEFRAWLGEVGLVPQPLIRTLIHCGVLPAVKPA